MRRVLLRVLLVAGVLAAAFVTFVAVKMGPRNLIGMLRYDQRKVGTLKPGDRAPDVSLVALDGATLTPLSASIGARPLVLVFGSFT